MAKPRNMSWSAVIWGLFVSIFLLGFAWLGASLVREQLVTGRTYSPGVVVGFSNYCYRSQTPVSYWGFIGLYICTLSFMVLIGALNLVQTICDVRCKLKTKGL
jgi:hypothetical protein